MKYGRSYPVCTIGFMTAFREPRISSLVGFFSGRNYKVFTSLMLFFIIYSVDALRTFPSCSTEPITLEKTPERL